MSSASIRGCARVFGDLAGMGKLRQRKAAKFLTLRAKSCCVSSLNGRAVMSSSPRPARAQFSRFRRVPQIVGLLMSEKYEIP
jgi:hypothetical protein